MRADPIRAACARRSMAQICSDPNRYVPSFTEMIYAINRQAWTARMESARMLRPPFPVLTDLKDIV